MLGAVLTTLLAASPPVSTQAIGVLCTGAADRCASLQAGVAGKLVSPAIAVIPPADLAKALAVRAEEPKTVAREKELLDQAESAYYHANWAEARARLDEAEKIQSAEPLTAGDAPRLLVLRGALSLKQGMKEKASADVKAAVELDPDYDAGSFPPAVQSLVDKAKGELPTEAILKVKVSPPDAVVTLDGRMVSGSISVVPGSHTLVVRAPGYSTMAIKGLKGAEDQTLRVELPVAAPAPLSEAVAGWLAAGATGPAPGALEEAARQAQADVLVVLVPQAADQTRAVLFAGGKATASGPLPTAKIVDWVGRGLATRAPPATPVPAATPVAAAATPTPTPKEVAAVLPAAGAGAGATALVPHPQTNPAIAPPPVTQNRPLTKRPVFWMVVGGAAVAITVAALAAGSGGGGGGTTTVGNPTGNLGVTFTP